MAFVSHRGRKASSSAGTSAASSRASSVRPHSCCRKASSLSSAVCRTGGRIPAAACRTHTVSASSTAVLRYWLQSVVRSNSAASNWATASHTGPMPRPPASMRSVRSSSLASTGSSSRVRKITSPWSRAFHSFSFIVPSLCPVFLFSFVVQKRACHGDTQAIKVYSGLGRVARVHAGVFNFLHR